MSSFQIFNDRQILSLRKGGKVLRDCLTQTAERVRPGIDTGALDLFAEDFIRSHAGATPAFKGYHGFPATLCISINEQCVHGIPGKRVIEEGDIVSLDGGVIYDDLYTDACITVPAGAVPPNVRNGTDSLIASTTRAPAIPNDLRVSSCAQTPPY